jgi:hypothetical protein
VKEELQKLKGANGKVKAKKKADQAQKLMRQMHIDRGVKPALR